MKGTGHMAAMLASTLAVAGDWLTDEDDALVAVLGLLADELDESFSTATMNQYLKALDTLHARKAERIAEWSPMRKIGRLGIDV